MIDTEDPLAMTVASQPVDVPRSLFSSRRRTLILGTGQLAKELGQVLVFETATKYQVVGFLGADPTRIGERFVNPGIVGTYDELAKIVEQYNIDSIAICLEDRRSVLPVQVLLELKARGVDITDGHHLFEEASGRLAINSLRPSALIFSTGFHRRWISGVMKRIFDVLLSMLGLVIFLPLFALIAVCIRLDSPGPVLYPQVRVGLGGRPFTMLKFRTMGHDAENVGPQWAQADDSRASRVGRWLRKTRLDELPQFINVLRRDMSFVGPRPERPCFVQELKKVIPYYDIRHTVSPGITGWAQVRFRYAASEEDSHRKLEYDLYYVKNLSLLFDLRILFDTISVVLSGNGAR